jgi:hypothetical protein
MSPAAASCGAFLLRITGNEGRAGQAKNAKVFQIFPAILENGFVIPLKKHENFEFWCVKPMSLRDSGSIVAR